MKFTEETVKPTEVRSRIGSMSEQTITEFLEARIAEDEALALNAQHHDAKAPGVWATEHHNSEYHDQPNSAHIAEDRAWHYWTVASEVFIPNAEHIARHDPARVLAECSAKRAIIKQHEDWPVLVEKKPEFSEDTSDIHSMTYRASQELAWLTEREYVKRFGVQAPTTNMVKALASVYADHQDYAQEWAP